MGNSSNKHTCVSTMHRIIIPNAVTEHRLRIGPILRALIRTRSCDESDGGVSACFCLGSAWSVVIHIAVAGLAIFYGVDDVFEEVDGAFEAFGGFGEFFGVGDALFEEVACFFGGFDEVFDAFGEVAAGYEGDVGG